MAATRAIALIAPVGVDPHVVSRGKLNVDDRRSELAFARALHRPDLEAEVGECIADLSERRPSRRRAQNYAHQRNHCCSQEHTAGHIGREARAEVHRGERDKEHQERQESAQRSNDVRREHECERSRDGDVDRRVYRPVTNPHVDGETLDRMGTENLRHEEPDAPGRNTRERDPRCHARAPGDQERDGKNRDGDDGAEPVVDDLRDALEIGSELVERSEEVDVERRLRLGEHPEHDHSDRRRDQAHDVGRAALGLLVRVPDPGHRVRV